MPERTHKYLDELLTTSRPRNSLTIPESNESFTHPKDNYISQHRYYSSHHSKPTQTNLHQSTMKLSPAVTTMISIVIHAIMLPDVIALPVDVNVDVSDLTVGNTRHLATTNDQPLRSDPKDDHVGLAHQGSNNPINEERNLYAMEDQPTEPRTAAGIAPRHPEPPKHKHKCKSWLWAMPWIGFMECMFAISKHPYN